MLLSSNLKMFSSTLWENSHSPIWLRLPFWWKQHEQLTERERERERERKRERERETERGERAREREREKREKERERGREKEREYDTQSEGNMQTEKTQNECTLEHPTLRRQERTVKWVGRSFASKCKTPITADLKILPLKSSWCNLFFHKDSALYGTDFSFNPAVA